VSGMNCVKHVPGVLAIIIVLAICRPGLAQISNTPPPPTQEPEFSATFTAGQFKFEMPAELQSTLPQDKARTAPKAKPPREPWLNLGFLGPVFQLVFYAILAFAVLYILYLILSTIITARRNYSPKDDGEDLPEIPTYQPDKETARVLLDDADKLASQGKFAEAVHAILFRSIQDIEDKRPHHVKRSLTSREIGKLSILSPTARTGFARIGKLVESSFFGGQALGVQDYEISKAAYKDFAFEKLARNKVRR